MVYKLPIHLRTPIELTLNPKHTSITTIHHLQWAPYHAIKWLSYTWIGLLRTTWQKNATSASTISRLSAGCRICIRSDQTHATNELLSFNKAYRYHSIYSIYIIPNVVFICTAYYKVTYIISLLHQPVYTIPSHPNIYIHFITITTTTTSCSILRTTYFTPNPKLGTYPLRMK